MDLPADSLPTTKVRGVCRFDGGAARAVRAVARKVLTDARDVIAYLLRLVFEAWQPGAQK